MKVGNEEISYYPVDQLKEIQCSTFNYLPKVFQWRPLLHKKCSKRGGAGFHVKIAHD